jgi:hypothetical protein
MQQQMMAIAYLGSQCTIFHAADFLRPFIWNHVLALMQICNGYVSECASNFVQILENV